jgi:predicted amidohydrolase
VRPPLTIAAAQPPTVTADITTNAHAHAEAVQSARARVVVFPELSLTGYDFPAPTVNPEDPRLAPIVAACARTGSLALVGAPVPDEQGSGTAIGVLAVDGTGSRVAYRKMWLGGTEPTHFTPGTTPTVIEVEGWRLGLAVCRDTGVPQHVADTAALGMDVYVAGVLDHAHHAHVPDERARRIAPAYGVWVVTASFAGATGEGYTHAAGRSRTWDPTGRLVAETGDLPGGIARAELT